MGIIVDYDDGIAVRVEVTLKRSTVGIVDILADHRHEKALFSHPKWTRRPTLRGKGREKRAFVVFIVGIPLAGVQSAARSLRQVKFSAFCLCASGFFRSGVVHGMAGKTISFLAGLRDPGQLISSSLPRPC